VRQTGLGPRIEPFCSAVDARRPETARNAAAAIATLVAGAALTDEAAAAIDAAADCLLRLAPLVVRSSAIGEDGADASFAGQLDSILHVATHEALTQAVRQCWGSYWSERALWYRAARGVSLAGMGVIVQRQVAAVTSGVCFTQDPGGSDALLVESCDGLADGLVSGRVDPVQQLIPRAAADHDDLARIAMAIEQRAGRPQDIEWARDPSGAIWIVQARAITTRPRSASPADMHSPSTTRTCVWSNANVSENFPEPISPLLYSIASAGYYHYFRNLGLTFGVSKQRLKAMDRPLRTIVGVQGARLYYNLTNLHAVLRMAPFGESLARAFNTFVGVSEVAAAPDGAVTWRDRRARAGQALELIRIAAATTWQYAFFRRRLESFERTADAFADATSSDAVNAASLTELAVLLDRFIDIRCHRWTNASLADAGAMVCYALLERTLAAAGAEPDMLHRLLRSLPGVPSSQPPRRLWALSRLIRQDEAVHHAIRTLTTPEFEARLREDPQFAAVRSEFERYLDDWGFRSSAELMLTVPTLQERPAPIIDLLRGYVERDTAAPETVMAAQASERCADTARLLRRTVSRVPHLVPVLWLLIRWTHRAIAFRERARLKQALLYTRCRRIALAIGQRLLTAGRIRHRDDIFMLTWQEIGDVAAGRAMFADSLAEIIALRRTQHDALSRTRPPDRIELEPQVAWTPGASSQATDTPLPAGPGDLRGIGASSGRVTARAAVLADVAEAHLLRDGDILVTRQTDPGWGLVFCLVSGLVIERGGMLSHGAIIAREFGLPCVVGIPSATTRIRHGQCVTVDGDAGTCRIEAATESNGDIES
jgi:rifampicin phosphotransferase